MNNDDEEWKQIKAKFYWYLGVAIFSVIALSQ